MSIRNPTRICATMLCVVFVMGPVGQATAQSQYPAYGVTPLGFGSGGVVANPHSRDLYNGATVATPGTFMDRFRSPDGAPGSVPCDPSGNGLGTYGQAGREIRTPQSDRPGMFHDRFAGFRRPDPSEPSSGAGPGLDTTAGPASGCR